MFLERRTMWLRDYLGESVIINVRDHASMLAFVQIWSRAEILCCNAMITTLGLRNYRQ